MNCDSQGTFKSGMYQTNAIYNRQTTTASVWLDSWKQVSSYKKRIRLNWWKKKKILTSNNAQLYQIVLCLMCMGFFAFMINIIWKLCTLVKAINLQHYYILHFLNGYHSIHAFYFTNFNIRLILTSTTFSIKYHTK